MVKKYHFVIIYKCPLFVNNDETGLPYNSLIVFSYYLLHFVRNDKKE